MDGEFLFLAGIAAIACSGFPGILIRGTSPWAERLSASLCISGSSCAVAAIAGYLNGNDVWLFQLELPTAIAGVRLRLALDFLSVIFLLPILGVAAFGSIYDLGYWKQSEHPGNGRRLRFFYGLLAAAMCLLVLARDSLSFLFAWEIMALAAFFLVATDDGDPEVMRAAWLYVVVSHVATLFLFGMFALMFAVTGTFAFTSLDAAPTGLATAIFILGLIGLGAKAGLMPMHIWLPSAHAMAPSHISALLSGVVIKMGAYGLIRLTSLFSLPPVWWGELVLAAGTVTAVLGIAFAMGQRDIKRLLAYSSIENIGIIFIALGLALAGKALNRPDWVTLGLAGVFLHVWNHAAFKSLLFFAVGSVVHAAGTRDIEMMGGLGRQLRLTGAAFLVGSLAICGLPPLNGFVSELVIFLGLFQTLGLDGGPALGPAGFAAPALALTGALAVATYVKLYGVVFLGKARSEKAAHGHEAPFAMRVPVALLGLVCFTIGLAPFLTAPLIDNGVGAWTTVDGPQIGALAPLGWVSVGGEILLLSVAGLGVILWAQLRRVPVAYGPTWGCGYLGQLPRPQYSSSSFAQMLVNAFSWATYPIRITPRLTTLFPKSSQFKSFMPDTVLDRAVVPCCRLLYRLFGWSRLLHQGNIQVYLLFIVATVIFLLIWR